LWSLWCACSMTSGRVISKSSGASLISAKPHSYLWKVSPVRIFNASSRLWLGVWMR
jgi:hypothetical protein